MYLVYIIVYMVYLVYIIVYLGSISGFVIRSRNYPARAFLSPPTKGGSCSSSRCVHSVHSVHNVHSVHSLHSVFYISTDSGSSAGAPLPHCPSSLPGRVLQHPPRLALPQTVHRRGHRRLLHNVRHIHRGCGGLLAICSYVRMIMLAA